MLGPLRKNAFVRIFLFTATAMVAVQVIAFYFIERASYKDQIESLRHEQAFITQSQAVIVPSHLAGGDDERVMLILSAVLANPDIIGVSIANRAGDTIHEFGQFESRGDTVFVDQHAITRFDGVGVIELGQITTVSSDKRIVEAQREARDLFVIALGVELLVTLAAAYLSLHVVIGVPLRKLIHAIKQFHAGTPLKVDWRSEDEIGLVIAEFDKLQTKQLASQSDLREALARAEEIARDLKVEKARAEEASEVKSQFLANTSHELRTPMNGVLGMTELLLQGPLTADQRHQVERIRQSGESLLHLLNNILDLSRIEAGRMDLEIDDFDLSKLIDGVVGVLEPTARSKGIGLDATITGGAPLRLRGDGARMNQLLLNLVGNAIKFTEVGGVTIKADARLADDRRVAIMVEVIDTGIGIAEEALATIFDAFTQADNSTTRLYGGSGLGLSICKQLVQLMGGEIGADSVVGAGSRFWFKVDCALAEEDTENPELRGEMPIVAIPKLRILLAEDNVVNQEVAVMTLEHHGHTVTCVGNGVEAVHAVETGSYDLILMDIQMPEMDGVAATKAIRALPGTVAGVPIIALTANVMKGDRERYLAAGMNGYVEKPLQADRLFSTIQTIFPAAAAA